MGVPGNANALLLRSAAAAGGYQISRSLRFNSADSAFLSRTPGSAGNRKTWTWSAWVKKTSNGSGTTLFYSDGSSDSTYFNFNFNSNDTLGCGYYSSAFLATTQVFRDNSAWYHIVIAFDSTQATAANRIKLYVNGSEITSFSTDNRTLVTQNGDFGVNNTSAHNIGREAFSGGRSYFNGYIADIYFLDGVATTPSTFAETDATTGAWNPKAFSGSYGTQGWHLDFADNSSNTATTLGKDTSGNGNNWTPNNLSVTAGAGNDSLVDVPTNGTQTDTGVGGEVRGNYCTLNPIVGGGNASQITYANGNLEATWSTAVNYAATLGTIGVSSGKWYWETTIAGSSGYWLLGIATGAVSLTNYIGADSNGYSYYSLNGNKYNSGASASYGNSYTQSDVIGVALDLDNGRVFFSKNGTWQNSGSPTGGTGAAYTGLSGTFFPAYSEGTNNAASSYICNFGQRPFAYTAPSGFKALCTANLPTPTILKGSTYFDVTLYTGNDSTKTISGLNFSPDFLWLKTRSVTQNHLLYDTVRGYTQFLNSNNTNAEGTGNGSTDLTGFTSDGFTLGGNVNGANYGSATYAAWCWDAAGSNSTNTSGSITSSVRANATAGFSVVTFNSGSSGQKTIGHGLGVAPEFIISKDRSNNAAWIIYHKSLGTTSDYLLFSTNAKLTSSNIWGSTAPSSTVFGFDSGTNSYANANVVCYCFAPVAGYSSFGSYTGNGSSDGPFVYTGFRPRYIMIKRTDSAGYDWFVIDTARSTYNTANDYLAPNSSTSENGFGGATFFDILSNGYKLRTDGPSRNASSGTYVYAAFAESPFNYSRAR